MPNLGVCIGCTRKLFSLVFLQLFPTGILQRDARTSRCRVPKRVLPKDYAEFCESQWLKVRVEAAGDAEEVKARRRSADETLTCAREGGAKLRRRGERGDVTGTLPPSSSRPGSGGGGGTPRRFLDLLLGPGKRRVAGVGRF